MSADILKTDELGLTLTELVKTYKPKTIIEIGSSDGTGSSSVLAKAIEGTDCKLFLMEAVTERFSKLIKNVNGINIYHYNVSSVDLDGMVSEEYVRSFLASYKRFNVSKLYPLRLVMSWYKETEDIIRGMDVKNGIDYIKTDHRLNAFDIAFIDGSPFTGMAELTEVYGSKIIVMDDTMDIKCYDAMSFLLTDPSYSLIKRNDRYRNGYAVFKMKENANS